MFDHDEFHRDFHKGFGKFAIGAFVANLIFWIAVIAAIAYAVKWVIG